MHFACLRYASELSIPTCVMPLRFRDGPLEKWEWGKNPKKIHARVNAKKKNSCKEEDNEEKFMQKESPIVAFI